MYFQTRIRCKEAADSLTRDRRTSFLLKLRKIEMMIVEEEREFSQTTKKIITAVVSNSSNEDNAIIFDNCENEKRVIKKAERMMSFPTRIRRRESANFWTRKRRTDFVMKLRMEEDNMTVENMNEDDNTEIEDRENNVTLTDEENEGSIFDYEVKDYSIISDNPVENYTYEEQEVTITDEKEVYIEAGHHAKMFDNYLKEINHFLLDKNTEKMMYFPTWNRSRGDSISFSSRRKKDLLMKVKKINMKGNPEKRKLSMKKLVTKKPSKEESQYFYSSEGEEDLAPLFCNRKEENLIAIEEDENMNEDDIAEIDYEEENVIVTDEDDEGPIFVYEAKDYSIFSDNPEDNYIYEEKEATATDENEVHIRAGYYETIFDNFEGKMILGAKNDNTDEKLNQDMPMTVQFNQMTLCDEEKELLIFSYE
ncbi:hypothetical protein NPIL_26301 [Nephila pilipes]|uniref:Uncharacterized protein n=1 Tax=Nephila pilipes TaxID=299642 RepID=A0A8X6KAI7_NEPPI|nr:hypothetical protein NPIL_26301 [Nephila pilipes]